MSGLSFILASPAQYNLPSVLSSLLKVRVCFLFPSFPFIKRKKILNMIYTKIGNLCCFPFFTQNQIGIFFTVVLSHICHSRQFYPADMFALL